MFNLFFKNKKNNQIREEEFKIKWDEIDEDTKRYMQIEKETFEEQNILSQQLFIQIATVKKENEYEKNINIEKNKDEKEIESIIEKNNFQEIILSNNKNITIEYFKKWVENIEMYAQNNNYEFNNIYMNLKKEKQHIYSRIKCIERNIENNITKTDKKDIRYTKIKEYNNELINKINEYRIKKILYEILSEIKKTINRKNKIKNLNKLNNLLYL